VASKKNNLYGRQASRVPLRYAVRNLLQ
jgi:hypothetical protein